MNWKEYQQEVADLFISIGALAETDANVKGVRGKHKVDVLVKLKHLGINITWIIECKLWKTSIPKEKILALQQIMQDVGADRGFMMSESGFQAGCIKIASTSNVTLSSLSELRDLSTEEYSKIKMSFITSRLNQLTKRYHTFIPRYPFNNTKPFHLIDGYFPDLFTIRIELFKAQSNNFPIYLSLVKTTNIQEFIRTCECILDGAEKDIQKVEEEYNKTFDIGIESYKSLKKFIKKLLCSSKDIVENSANPSKVEEIRISAVEIMKEVGELTLQLRSYTNNISFPAYQSIHKLIIDQLYINLMDERLENQKIDLTSKYIHEAFSQFETVFQPINIPPEATIPA